MVNQHMKFEYDRMRNVEEVCATTFLSKIPSSKGNNSAVIGSIKMNIMSRTHLYIMLNLYMKYEVNQNKTIEEV